VDEVLAPFDDPVEIEFFLTIFFPHVMAHLLRAAECFKVGEFGMSAGHLSHVNNMVEKAGERIFSAESEGGQIAAMLSDLCGDAERAERERESG
jgi:hypothetical protein